MYLQKKQSVEIKYPAGVRGVSNKIDVKPELQPSEIKEVIEVARKRNAG